MHFHRVLFKGQAQPELYMADVEPWFAWSGLGLSFVFAASMTAGEAAGWRVPTYRAIWGHDLGKTPPS